MSQDLPPETIDTKEKTDANLPPKTPTSKSQLPTIAGFLLLMGGFFAIINWISFFSLDASTLQSSGILNQLQQVSPGITVEDALNFFRTCATIGIVISIFMILGGVLSIRRKIWGVALACSIIGLFSIGLLFTSSFISFVAVIILIVTRKQF